MLPTVIKEQGFSAAFSLVVARAWADWVDMPPIGFRLRMHARIPIYFASRSLQNWAPESFRKAERINGAVHANFGGRHRIVLVVDGRSRAREVKDSIDFYVEGKSDVVTNRFE